jgi:hypothetical protein
MSPPKTTRFSSAGERSQNRVKEKQLSEAATPPGNRNKYKLREEYIQEMLAVIHFST